MIEEILPPTAVSAEEFGDVAARLFPAEEEAVAQAVESRRREFATVRACARAALARLQVAPGPLVPGPRGAPSWPDGIVGSMTHCAGYRAAAVARAGDLAALGVDAEPDEPLPDGVLDAIASREERERLAVLAARSPGTAWDRLLFSAKESVYKAWFPLAGRMLDFTEAVVAVDAAAGSFSARLLVPGPVLDGRVITGFAGRWLVRGGLVVTAIAVPPSGR
ncbi:4'-phosphopantetheinyl transferase family protein [Actinomadura opuntiae]|uniref:4'-phosphopantetheinyl transferase family protein n=1 Tax=Actinomadura sp. OS1-43 TaxID=604315 RepID=UPI00255A940C|nr:4'-phosphopantetheinyl transferase superfamily protein [Actinomadura sp. OS1-43]MDL4815448.1 4'-phosphopantetheinyl transferase superfamily protein [Actinomadura sp. OS1-43]